MRLNNWRHARVLAWAALLGAQTGGACRPSRVPCKEGLCHSWALLFTFQPFLHIRTLRKPAMQGAMEATATALLAAALRGAPPAPVVQGAEPDRPTFHVAPAQGWLNDPNGLIFYRGRYHL